MEKNKKTLFLLLRITLVAIIFSYLLFNFNIEQFKESLKTVNIGLLFISIFVSVFVIYLASMRFIIILNKYKIKIIKLKLFLTVYYSQFIDNFFLGFLGGDGYKILNIRGKKKKLLKAVILDRITGLIVLILFSIPGSILYLCQITHITEWHKFFLISLLIFLIACFIFYFKRKESLTLFKEFKEILINPKLLAMGIIIQLLMILNLYIVFRALNWNILPMDALVFIPLISLIITLPISIKGYGIREFLIIFFFNVDINQVLVFTLINTAITILHTSLGAIAHVFYEKKN